MRQEISALMDGELGSEQSSSVIQGIAGDDVNSRTWREYHLISDVLQGVESSPNNFAARVNRQIAAEPTVLSPKPKKHVLTSPRWVGLSAAASFAAVALVGWIAFAPQSGMLSTELASHTPAAGSQAKVDVRQELSVTPLPKSTNDYLLAHQAYSPRGSLQGVAPYIRTVSETARAQ